MNLPSGIVKSVLSADTIVIRGRPVSGPPPERTLSLAWISAPRFSKTDNEFYAFEAREFLRKRIVGKTVTFKVEYSSASGREFASIFLDGVNISHDLLKNGCVSLRSNVNNADADPILAELETEAKTAALGIWTKSEHSIRQISYSCDNLQKYFEKNKHVSRRAIVEQVRDGSSIRVMFYDDFQVLNLNIAGIKAPAYRKDIPNMEDLVEPFGDEAKFFVESRLLQREVEITIVGLVNQTMLAIVSHPAGNIALALLSNGLARILDWAVPYISSSLEELRKAEFEAKSKKIRLWKDFEQTANITTLSFYGVVTKIISGDTLLIERESKGDEVKITLSSIRQPKLKEESALNSAAREFLRTKLIGKKVTVEVDYVKPPSEGFEQRTCATVTSGNKNVAEMLLSKGLAYVIKHKQDDPERSKAYDALLIAENEAKNAKLGIYSTEQLPQLRITDASENVTKARSFLPFFQRAGRINAVVEHIISGNKMKLFLARDSTKITFALGGIRCPKAARNQGEKEEPFGNEALKFSTKLVLQRDVEIEVEGLDKSGGFIGTMWIHKKENLAVKLLEEGLAFIFGQSADNSAYTNQLYTAENNAKALVKGIWSVEEPKKEQVVTQLSAQTSQVYITEITTASSGYLQICNNELEQLTLLMKELEFNVKSSITSTSSAPTKPLKAGDLVCAKFSADNQWYRAKIVKNISSDQIQVFYIDYGNSETLSPSKIRPIDAKFLKLAPQACEFKLSNVNTPSLEDDYGKEALEFFKDLTDRPKIMAVFDARIGPVFHVTLYDSELVPDINHNLINLSVNATMIKQGYAQAEKRKKNPNADIAVLLQLESFARTNRLGMFEYGDFDLGQDD